MQRGKLILTLTLVLMLCGCSVFQSEPDVVFDENFSHPELPSPVRSKSFEWKVVTKDNLGSIDDDTVLIALDYKDSLTFREFLEDTKRYIIEMNNTVCYYRRDLEEQFCKKQKRFSDD